MTKIYLIRHGMAAAAWGEHRDPGLNDLGRQQAAKIADELRPLGPMPVITSPLLRARETAAAFEKVWQTKACIDARLSELPCPVKDSASREAWLNDFINTGWSATTTDLRLWRDKLVGFVIGLDQDTLVTTHFVAINAIAGFAQKRDATLCFHPANASCTRLEIKDGDISIVTLGQNEVASRYNV